MRHELRDVREASAERVAQRLMDVLAEQVGAVTNVRRWAQHQPAEWVELLHVLAMAAGFPVSTLGPEPPRSLTKARKGRPCGVVGKSCLMKRRKSVALLVSPHAVALPIEEKVDDARQSE
jgi:hypothetical protein